MTTTKKLTIAVVALAVALVCVVGVTLAYLVDTTAEVTNTFTVGNVDISLTETTGETYKMVPGSSILKDPTVTVEGGSEACWLFVEITESSSPALTDYVTYAVAAGWTNLSGNVYYREVSAADADQTFGVLKDDKVSVKDTVTKDMMDSLESGDKPTLTFKAYAVQKDNVSTAAAAWAIANSGSAS